VRALISVYDKAGAADFARGLVELGFELVSSGGTASALEEAGLTVTRVEDVTGFPEMLGGRVKTLHPTIHAGILARRELEEDLAAVAAHGIELFDLVCVNLYPFELAVDRPELDETGLVEMIDIGGPALLRAAAKSFASVVAVCRPQDYEDVLSQLWAGRGTTTPPNAEMGSAASAFAWASSIVSATPTPHGFACFTMTQAGPSSSAMRRRAAERSLRLLNESGFPWSCSTNASKCVRAPRSE